MKCVYGGRTMRLFAPNTPLRMVPGWVSIVLAVVLVIVLPPPSEIRAQELDLEEANRQFANPLTRATLFIIEHDYLSANGNITNEDRHAHVTVIEPVIPIALGTSGWSLVNRPILPIAFDAELPVSGTGGGPEGGVPRGITFDKKSGLGDFTFFTALSPDSAGRFNWGVGPVVRFPTATKDELGAEKWSAGPMAVGVYSADIWSAGFLNQNLFSFAGTNSRKDVRVSTLQYFAFYNFTPEWGVGTAPIIAYNWEAGSDEKLSFPLGIGVTRTFRVGKVPMRMLFEYQNYVIAPDTLGLEQNFRVALAMFLPKFGN